MIIAIIQLLKGSVNGMVVFCVYFCGTSLDLSEGHVVWKRLTCIRLTAIIYIYMPSFADCRTNDAEVFFDELFVHFFCGIDSGSCHCLLRNSQ